MKASIKIAIVIFCFANAGNCLDTTAQGKAINPNNLRTLDSEQRTPTINVSKIGGKISVESNDDPLDKHLPWISAMIIGAASVVASWFIASKQIKALNNQITTSIELARQQNQSSSDSTIQTLRANIVSANRQEWINELRELTSKFISEVHSLNVDHYRVTNSGKPFELTEKWSNVADNLIYYTTKIELMLNPEEMATQEILKAFDRIRTNIQETNFTNTGDNIMSLMHTLQSVFKTEWIKIKNLQ